MRPNPVFFRPHWLPFSSPSLFVLQYLPLLGLGQRRSTTVAVIRQPYVNVTFDYGFMITAFYYQTLLSSVYNMVYIYTQKRIRFTMHTYYDPVSKYCTVHYAASISA